MSQIRCSVCGGWFAGFVGYMRHYAACRAHKVVEVTL